jgi:hypothetical protein
MIRLHFKVDPDTLSDNKYAALVAELQWLMRNKQIPEVEL